MFSCLKSCLRRLRLSCPLTPILAAALGLVLVLGLARSSSASSPQLNLILPRGVQRGADHQLVFSGARLNDAEEIFLYDSGIEVLGLEQLDANQIRVSIRVNADCRLGEHVAQVRTRHGISEFRNFFVGPFPEVAEAEPNNDFATPQPVELGQTIAGVVASEDVDYYQVEMVAGQRLSVEIEGIRLAGPFWDPFISILDENRFELAASDDSFLLQQDGHLSILAPHNGKYWIAVRDSAYQGSDAARYRLHVGQFPRPTVVYPAGGRPGDKVNLTFLGDPSGPLTREWTLPERNGFRSGLFPEDDLGVAPSPVEFRLVDLNNFLEAEPNNARNAPNAAPAFPLALNGVIEEPGDIDYFLVPGKKDQIWELDCFARRLRSGLDPVVNIFNSQGQSLVGNDDARRPDSFIRFTVPADGDYLIRVRDHLGRGQEDFVYRIEIRSPAVSLVNGIPRVDRYSQTRQRIAIPQGGRYVSLMNATRENFSGALVPSADNALPLGVTVTAVPMAANLNLMPVQFEATADAPIAGQLQDFKLQLDDPNRQLAGGFANLGDFVLGPPNNSLYVGCTVDKLAIAVVEKLPFSVELIQPKVPIVRNGQMQLKIVVRRDEGFKQPIQLQFPFRPPGIGTRNTVNIPADQNEAYYPINANAQAQLGTWPVYVLATANVNGPAYCCSELIQLEVAQPFVTLAMNRASAEQGQPVVLSGTVNKIADFPGKATVRLLGLPPEVTAPEIQIDATTTEVTFSASTTEKSPVGNHKGILCQLIIEQNGERIVSTAGGLQLQLNKPIAPPQPPADQPAASEKPAEKPPAPPQEKPLSRLEQLRQQKAKQNGG